MNAAYASDLEHLRDLLREAARNFDDVANSLEKKDGHNHIDWLRATAKRYRAELEIGC